MLVVGGLTAIAAGIFCFTDTETAWRLYELDTQLLGQLAEQPRDWRVRVQYMGMFLVFLGATAIILGFRAF